MKAKIDNSKLDIGDNPADTKIDLISSFSGPFSLAQHVKLRLYFEIKNKTRGNM